MAARRLIVHGDDFGLSLAVNEGIVAAHCRGILTSTSLIASGEAFEHAVEVARGKPTLDVGVHLTLVGEKPLSALATIPTLLADDGRLHPDAGTFAKNYFRGLISLEEIRSELDAQIAKIVDSGLRVTHIDGHQHLHMLPAVRRIVGELAARYRIRCIRYPSEAPRLYMFREPSQLGRLAQLFVLDLFCLVSDARDTKRCDHFCGFFYGGRLSRENLARVLDHLPAAGTFELMCHPGGPDSSSSHPEWGYRWEQELDALTDPAVRQYLRAEEIELISYAGL
jgi:hopanoid biosynthesis associated protein HpnK